MLVLNFARYKEQIAQQTQQNNCLSLCGWTKLVVCEAINLPHLQVLQRITHWQISSRGDIGDHQNPLDAPSSLNTTCCVQNSTSNHQTLQRLRNPVQLPHLTIILNIALLHSTQALASRPTNSPHPCYSDTSDRPLAVQE